MTITPRSVVLVLAVLLFLVAAAWARSSPPHPSAAVAGWAGLALFSASFLLPG